ncbi:MAG: LysR family transcriptional regulator [Gammaproteobacteria bacterium]|jgi:LysR family transcriptional regulator, low CO2-responsive transcriptional regulator
MPIRRATLHQLRIFDALAQHMSITRTAQMLHLTPPAVSIQVKQLAEAAGQPLVEQVGKKLFLTEAGKAVASACRDVSARMERLVQELAAIQGLEKGTLSVSILTTAKYFVPQLLGQLSAQHPGIEVSLFVGNRKAILDRLAHNQDDLYILGQPPENLGVVTLPFAPNPLVAIAHPEHPLAGQKNIAPQRLAEEPFIARERGSGTRLGCEAFFQRHDTAPRVRMELGSNEAIKQTVAGRLGISIIAKITVEAEIARGNLAILDVEGLPLERQWHLVYPEHKVLAPAAQAFKDFLISQHIGEDVQA